MISVPWRRRAVASIALCGLVFAACSGDDDDAETTSAPAATDAPAASAAPEASTVSDTSDAPEASSAPDASEAPASTGEGGEPQVGGSITYAMQLAPFRGFDPVLASGGVIDQQYLNMVYGSLIYLDSEAEVIPGMATSVEPNEDFTEWTITLRDGLTFTDGTDFTVDAIVDLWDRIADPQNASPAILGISEVESTEVLDPQTLVVHLNRADGTWDQVLATTGAGMIPSPTAVAAAGESYGATPETTVGAGPFVLTEAVAGDHFTFQRNEGYWDAPRPYLDEVVIRPITDHATRANTFSSGGADLLHTPNPSQPTADLIDAGYSYAEAVGAGVAALAINTQNAPTDDVRIRRALNLAIDRASVISRCCPGAEEATTIVSPDSPWANDVQWIAYDPEEAQALVDEYLAETGAESVEVNLIGATSAQLVWESFKQEWDKIDGLDVTLQVEDPAQTSVRTATRDYQNLLNATAQETPRAALTALASTSQQNLPFLESEAMDQVLQAANATNDRDEQTAAMTEYAELLLEEVPYVPQYRHPFRYFWQDSIHGVELQLSSGTLMMENVWKES